MAKVCDYGNMGIWEYLRSMLYVKGFRAMAVDLSVMLYVKGFRGPLLLIYTVVAIFYIEWCVEKP